MENYRRDVESTLYLLDNKPLGIFDGLSRADMRYLIHNPFSKNSPMQISGDIPHKILNQIPLLKPFELFISRCNQVRFIKLTKKGYLPTSLVREIDENTLKSPNFISIEIRDYRYSEKDSVSARFIRDTTEKSGLVLNHKNRLTVSQECREFLIKNDRQSVFHRIFMAYSQLFEWKKEIYQISENTGQDGFAYTLYLLSKYGKSYKPISFYVNKYYKAFSSKQENYDFIQDDMTTLDIIGANLIKMAHHESPHAGFELATFEKFLVRFNLVNCHFVQKPNFTRQLMIKKSKIFEKILTFKY